MCTHVVGVATLFHFYDANVSMFSVSCPHLTLPLAVSDGFILSEFCSKKDKCFSSEINDCVKV